MDTRIKEVAYLWRELNDKWYRIQTNSPMLIRKLSRRRDVKVCGTTTRGSSQFWRIFRLTYNRPQNARRSFLRLTGCGKNYKVVNGTIYAQIDSISNLSKGVEV